MFFKALKIFVLIVLSVLPAASQSTGGLPDDVMRIEILPGWRTAKGTHMAAFRLTMKDGWKTYWRAPGDGGIPPQFDWSGSKNLSGITFYWPRPEVSNTNGMRTIVYHNQVIIPVEITLKNQGKKLHLKGRVDLGVCNEICVPYSLKFSAKLDAGNTTPTSSIQTALNAQPMSAHRAGVKSARCLVEPITDGLKVKVILIMPSTGGAETVVIEPADQSVWVSEPVISRSGNTLTAISELVPPSNAPFALNRSKIRLTVLGSKRAVDILGCTG